MKYEASPQVTEVMSPDEIEHFLTVFAEYEPWENIKFVPMADCQDPTKGEEEEPMYTASNGKMMLCVFPLIRPNGERFVYLALKKECPMVPGIDPSDPSRN